MKRKIGVQLYSLRDYIKDLRSLDSCIKEIKKTGYDGVELYGLNNMDPSDIAGILKSSGLEVAAYHIGWVRYQNEIDQVIKELKLYGCEHAVIPGVFASEYRSFEGLKKFLDEVKAVSAKLKAEGISLAYHNHNHELSKYNGKTWLEHLYNNTTADELKAELDIYWLQAGGAAPASWIKKLKGRQTLLHLKDFVVTQDRLSDEALFTRLRAGVGAEQRVTEIGNGNIDFGAIISAADDAGIEWYIVEQDESFDITPLQSVKISFDNLVNLVQKGSR